MAETPKDDTIKVAGEAPTTADASKETSPERNPKTRKVRARRSKKASAPKSKAEKPANASSKAPSKPGPVLVTDLVPTTGTLPPAPLDSARDAALRRMGVTETPLRVDMTRFLQTAGGFERVMAELVPMVAEIDLRYRNLIKLYQEVSEKDRKSLYPEDYLYVCKIRPSDFYGEVSRAAMEYSLQVGILQQAAAHNEIMEAGLEVAKSPIGVSDRMAHLKAVGVMPLPKGAQIAIQNNYQGNDGKNPETAELPSFERQVIDAGSRPAVEDADFEEITE